MRSTCLKVLFLAILFSFQPGRGLCESLDREVSSSSSDRPVPAVGQTPGRKFSPVVGDKWIGEGISYGPYREGQGPGGELPTQEQLLEDLEIVSKRWNLIRMYGSTDVAEDVLKLIRQKKLPIRVLVGAWIDRETPRPDEEPTEDLTAAKDANQREVKNAIRLANSYADIVMAVSIGNETQVYWSAHRGNPDVLIGYIREARQNTKVPVTTADDFNFWNKPESKAVADEIDFIVTHIHPLWAGLPIEGALPWTQRIYEEVCRYHPSKTVVIGETGWATRVHNEGEQAKLIKGRADEEGQRKFFEDFTRWSRKEKICSFFFEAFDEPWKGGPHPNEVEKHWGLYFVDRTPKAALAEE